MNLDCVVMRKAIFTNGADVLTFAPLVLEDLRVGKTGFVRLVFGDWDWSDMHIGGDEIDGYYLNGYGLQSLAKAARKEAGLPVFGSNLVYESEGDVLSIRFESVDEACVTAELLQHVLLDKERLRNLVAVARRQGFEE